tara:strand:- start:35 stop:400 length:366 start_codon:yes stop_codon:yes gene_type:complete
MIFTTEQHKKSENKIQNEGISCALSLGVELTRTNAGKVKVRGGWMQLACKGWGDTTGYNQDGKIVMIEFKDVVSFNSKNHGANEDQLKRLNDIKSKGGVCGIACCNEHVESIISGNYVGLV